MCCMCVWVWYIYLTYEKMIKNMYKLLPYETKQIYTEVLLVLDINNKIWWNTRTNTHFQCADARKSVSALKRLETDKLVGLEETGLSRAFFSFSKLSMVWPKLDKFLKVTKLKYLPKPAARNRSWLSSTLHSALKFPVET